jgi:hypothetical protein
MGMPLLLALPADLSRRPAMNDWEPHKAAPEECRWYCSRGKEEVQLDALAVVWKDDE